MAACHSGHAILVDSKVGSAGINDEKIFLELGQIGELGEGVGDEGEKLTQVSRQRLWGPQNRKNAPIYTIWREKEGKRRSVRDAFKSVFG